MTVRILVVGCKGAGKSTLMNTLKNVKNNQQNEKYYSFLPTVGVENLDLEKNNINLNFKEIGSAMIPRLYKYFEEDFEYIFYLINASNTESIYQSYSELFNTIIFNKKKDTKLIILFNK